MFVEASRWIRSALEAIDLPPGSAVLDLGSSTLHYRTVEQPHVDGNVFAPLRERGAEVVHVDVKDAPGVDVVCDIDRADLDLVAELGRRFELVVCGGLLPCVSDPGHAIAAARDAVAGGGWLLATIPGSYRRTLDPQDNLWRPTPGELAAAIGGADGFEIPRADSVRVDDRRYYRGLLSRASWVPVAGRWLPLPGASESIRRLVPRWRWRESCVLARRASGEGSTPPPDRGAP